MVNNDGHNQEEKVMAITFEEVTQTVLNLVREIEQHKLYIKELEAQLKPVKEVEKVSGT